MGFKLQDLFVFNLRKVVNYAFVLFFSYRCWYALFNLGRTKVTVILSIFLMYIFVFFAAVLSKKIQSRIFVFLIVVCICATAFMVTYILHPNYGTWFFHNADYGVFNNVFFPTAGIYAFLFVCLCDNPDDMRKNLKIISYIMFIYGVYQLIPVVQTGYWNNVSKSGIQINQNTYSLGFGYRTVICAIVFYNEYKETGKKRYLLLVLLSLIAILLYGGRGCFLVFVFYVMLRYVTNVKGFTVGTLILLTSVAILAFLWGVGLLDQFIASVINTVGLDKSRTITKLLGGEMFEDNARTIIWSKAIELIKTGGLNGYGVYGDRMVIGKYYSWGYSHNIFLELMVSFGIWGLLLCGMLIFKIVQFIKKEKDNKWLNLFIIFLCLSCQLLISDSFWYNSWFWALLALMYQQKIRFKYSGNTCGV